MGLKENGLDSPINFLYGGEFYESIIEPRYKDNFPQNLFPILLQSLNDTGVDHIIITGDITNFSKPEEYDIFRSNFTHWIENNQISVVPGNHDTKLLRNSISFLDGLGDLIPKSYPTYIAREKRHNFPYVKILIYFA